MTTAKKTSLWSVEVIKWVGERFGTEPDSDIAYGLALSQSPELVTRIADYLAENKLPKTLSEMVQFLVAISGSPIDDVIEKYRSLVEIEEAWRALKLCVQALLDAPTYRLIIVGISPSERCLLHRFHPHRLDEDMTG